MLRIIFSLIFLSFSARFALAAGQVAEETQDIAVFLLDETENASGLYRIPFEKEGPRDLRFRHTIARNQQGYVSWALEFNDPSRDIFYRVSNEGRVPETIHWDGAFNASQSISPKGRYYYRLLLTSEDRKTFASPWESFSTRLKNRSEGVKVSEKFLNLYLSPSLGFESQTVQTKSYSNSSYALFGDLKFILNDKHTFGLRYEGTCDRFFSPVLSAYHLDYSDFSFSYRYNLYGKPLREAATEFDALAVQLGARAFVSVIRGGGNLPVDSESARSYQGLTGTLNFEHRLGKFRVFEGAELGYSLFKSKHNLVAFEAGAAYDGFRTLGIGIRGNYQMIDGTPEADSSDGGNGGTTAISNKVLMAGLFLYFKI